MTSSIRVLVAEDSPTARALLGRVLTQLAEDFCS